MPPEASCAKQPVRRIVLVTDAWHPQINGVVTVLTALTQNLQARGIEVHTIEPSMSARTMRLPWYPELQLALFPSRTIRRELLKREYDAIHIATEGPLGWAARKYCLKNNIPFSTAFHTNFQLYVAQHAGKYFVPLVTYVLRQFHAPAKVTLVATEALRHELNQRGFEHLSVYPLGVDTDLFRPRSVPLDRRLTRPVFCFIGRIVAEKAPESFLSLDLPGSKLVIGDGYQRAALERAFPHAVFVGTQRHEDLASWISQADVFVFPSKTETFGLVVLEALACGVPVAAYHTSGPASILTNGVDGCVGDDLRSAALTCLTLSPEACREKALQYSWHETTNRFLEAIAITNRTAEYT